MMMRVLFLAFTLLLIHQTASAQPTMAVWVDDGGVLTHSYDPMPGVAFDVVITLDTDGMESSYAEWLMTDLVATAGLLKLGVSSRVGNCGVVPENCFQGEYRIYFDSCAGPEAQIELVRIQFMDTVGITPVDSTVMLEPLSAEFGGGPGFRDCSGAEVMAPMLTPDGHLTLNPAGSVPGEAGSFGVLKIRY